MPEKRVWRGIQNNFALFQGEIVSDPVFSNDYAFTTLRTVVLQRDANSQLVEVDQDVPLMVEPGSPNLKVLRDYVKIGRKLQAWCHYKSWKIGDDMQHAFVIRKIDLGDKPYEGPSNGNPPSLPQ